MNDRPLRRILMVEDETDIQVVAQIALEAIGGFQVHLCSSGDEAIQLGPIVAPDLILLDVMMPGMDGPTTLRALRTLPETASTPVILMTARVQPHEIAQYKTLGVLEVVSKPFDPMTLSATIEAIWQRGQPTAADDLRVLSDSYAARIPEKLAQIERAWDAARRSGAREDLAALHRLAHSLHGSGATLGFARLSAAAGALERFLAPPRDDTSQARWYQAEIDRLLDPLRAAMLALGEQPLHAPTLAGDARDSTPAVLARPSAALGSAPDRRLLILIDVAMDIVADLSGQLSHFGYSIRTYAALDDVPIGAADQPMPAAIILGATPSNLAGATSGNLAAIGRRLGSDPPIMYLADRDDLATRLRVARAGADAFLARPINTTALIDKLDALISHHAPEPYRIVIVDDEPEQAHYYAAALRDAGMLTVVVTDPLRVMQPLAEFRPDVILMDVYMPGCDGMDLAAAIRQQEDYISIPIVFLSAETNRDMQLEALRLGGDDFMTKPITLDHLIAAVSIRVERSRTLRSFMVRDSLTGLFNHTATKERLEVELARARRQHTPMALAIIDIDHFKSVNDTYGHPTGDRVLKSLARLLQQRLRRTDIVGRYGGEEFAVVLAGADGPTAVGVLDEIRADLEQFRQQAGEHAFTVRFSCGVASFPEHPDAPALTEAADRALYTAKRDGRNRVVLAGQRPLDDRGVT